MGVSSLYLRNKYTASNIMCGESNTRLGQKIVCGQDTQGFGGHVKESGFYAKLTKSFILFYFLFTYLFFSCCFRMMSDAVCLSNLIHGDTCGLHDSGGT